MVTMKLKIIDFIKSFPETWKERLQNAPYSLTIKESGEYVLFTYSQIGSDFSIPLVQECRGLILNRHGWRPVCVPFFKFFNVQEQNAVDIDWGNARVLEKLDGSIIKLWFDNGWRVSTNGTIDARDASLSAPVSTMGYYKRIENYHDLFMYALVDINVEKMLSRLDTTMTYMFELVSPYNRVVVPYTETKLFHIGTRSNEDLLEWEYYIPEIDKPEVYDISSLEECLDSAEKLPFSEEGYVVVDHNYNRVKIKSAEYVIAHHLRNNGAVTRRRIVDMILANGQDDFLSIYPEYQESFDEVETAIWGYIAKLMKESTDVPDCETRKEFAQWALTTTNAGYFFGVMDGKWNDPKEWLWGLSNDKILEYIGLE